MLGPTAVFDRATRFTSEGQAWWGAVHRFPLATDRHLWIGVMVPEANLLQGTQQQRIWIAALTLSVLTLGIGRAVSLAAHYSRPVEKLTAEADRMSEGNLEPVAPIVSDVREVQLLARAHDRMRSGLRTLLRIEHDLKIARRIQQSTYPERLPTLPGFELAAWSEPATETGGDTYDVIGICPGESGEAISHTDRHAPRALLLLADATGHGIGPALSVTQVRAMLRMGARMSLDLSRIATQMNQQLCDDLPAGRFVTCWLGVLDSDDHTLTAVSAGQGPLLWYRARRDEFQVSIADTTPLGMFDRGEIAVPPPRRLEPGDLFVVASDGIFEAKNPAEEEFGEERVCQVIREERESTAGDVLQALRQATERFVEGAPADDDRTIIVIKRV
jgi:serine phosphatase RsbU (regulator of sigma subunit)